jgi:hypothetical protein
MSVTWLMLDLGPDTITAITVQLTTVEICQVIELKSLISNGIGIKGYSEFECKTTLLGTQTL